MDIIVKEKGAFYLTTDQSKMDRQAIHAFLSKEAYWSENIPFETVATSIENSLNFGIFYQQEQVAYARVITDFATFAYLCDVFVIANYRRQGLGEWLIQTVMEHPRLQGLRRWMLMTKDAHDLYKKNQWRIVAHPERCMEKHNPQVYKNPIK